MTYKYVTIEHDDYRMGIRLTTKFTSHRDIIDDHAKQGYRYVGYVPTKIGGQGDVLSMDLIFEKD